MESSSSLKDDNDDNSNGRRRLDAIVVVPTRELAMQVIDIISYYGHIGGVK